MPELLTTAEAAEILKVPARTLATWRSRKQGPPYVKVETVVRYLMEDLEQWVKDSTQGGAA